MGEGKPRRRYDRDFKEGAVRLVTDGGQTLSGTARDLGITENMLGRWKKEYLEDQEHAFPGKGRMKPVDAELFHLKKRIADLEQGKRERKAWGTDSPGLEKESKTVWLAADHSGNTFPGVSLWREPGGPNDAGRRGPVAESESVQGDDEICRQSAGCEGPRSEKIRGGRAGENLDFGYHLRLDSGRMVVSGCGAGYI